MEKHIHIKKVSSWRLAVGSQRLRYFALLLLLTAHCSLLTALGHGDEDHSAKAEVATTNATQVSPVSSVTAERNLPLKEGNFSLKLIRTPTDLRSGETAQFVLKLAEKVEGGFSDEPLSLEKATVVANISRIDGKVFGDSFSFKDEGAGIYRASIPFANNGDFKINFSVTTADNRTFATDFPILVVKSPLNWLFWLGASFLGLISFGGIATAFAKFWRGENLFAKLKKTVPVSVALLLFFAISTAAWSYFQPPRQTRVIAENAVSFKDSDKQSDATTGNITIPKESQLLFGIKTEPISERQITSGLKVNGIVKSRPDSRAVVSPPFAGKISLKAGLTIGSVVSKGEQIGTLEQILDVSTQAGLESQRLDIESQKQQVQAQNLQLETQRLGLQAAIVELNGRINEQKNLVLQSKIRLAQAQRELRRSENLVAVGAVPRKRLEEAQTAVKLAEQELSNNELQVKTLSNQVALTKTSATKLEVKFDAVKRISPRQNFPLTSPITGVITEIKATSGQQVESGKEILSIINLATVLLEAQVFENDLSLIRNSTRASFTAASLEKEVYTIGTADGDGRILSIGQTVNAETRNFTVIYEVKNPLQRLRDGMFVEMIIDSSGNQKVLSVPKNAVITEQGETFVFVFNGGETFEKRKIAVGTEGLDFYEIKSGLKKDERVVTDGIYQLRSAKI